MTLDGFIKIYWEKKFVELLANVLKIKMRTSHLKLIVMAHSFYKGQLFNNQRKN